MVATVGAEGSPEPANDDFRRRSAARRRERMRARLLEATMRSCAERGSRTVIIEDVLRAADVSRGTFYAHFESLHAAISNVAQRLADEATENHAAMYSGVDDPVLRTAVGPQLIMMRATLEPAWGATIIQSDEFLSRSTFVKTIRKDILKAMRQGLFRRTDVQAAVDLHLGAMIQGARTLQKRKRGRAAYIRSVATHLLLALGVPKARAHEAIEWTAQDLRERAPRFLPWWKDLN